jgi:hypothetical protein
VDMPRSHDDRFKAIEVNVRELEHRTRQIEVRQAVTEQALLSLKNSVDNIEANTKWLLRLVVGAIVLATMGLVMVKP